jgi:4a-hydroxytetrahydrobiopterin dehydratase
MFRTVFIKGQFLSLASSQSVGRRGMLMATTRPLSSSAIPTRFTNDQLKQLVPYLDSQGWKYDVEQLDGGKSRDLIEKAFLFKNFTEAFAFMTEAAFHAEADAHHPEWANVYNKVIVVLTTHDCGGLSMKDVEFARVLDNIHAKHSTSLPVE